MNLRWPNQVFLYEPTMAQPKFSYFLGLHTPTFSKKTGILETWNFVKQGHHDGLFLKCLQLGITGNLSKFIHQFLHDRTLQIRWRNRLSNTKVIQKGLAQGSALSPVMFAIFMFDFCETFDEVVKCSIFADDIFIYCSHSSLEYIEKKLQNTMENVFKWCTYWKLSISPEKSVIADLSKRSLLSTPRISYTGSPLPWKDSIKYLGIIFSESNQNGAIVKTLRAKALRKINALKTIAYKSYSPRTKDLVGIINNGICSLLYYSCAITNKLSQTHFKICDTIQTIALRVALGLPIWTPNIVLLKIEGQKILSEKIKRLAIQFFISRLQMVFLLPYFGNLRTLASNIIRKIRRLLQGYLQI
ncbi:hypothetical protein AVEN_84450-1 [Araneus ventricosus]|uniref:Reverse transcriptase domain-containing protein n=1 Tax=Araneus ventricosus TaxID=182803 RepID=A0A4Y2S0H6_ARAVE|nr:hypothetical protein AVEN_84450-1 [Araneus ventricosus]